MSHITMTQSNRQGLAGIKNRDRLWGASLFQVYIMWLQSENEILLNQALPAWPSSPEADRCTASVSERYHTPAGHRCSHG